MTYGELIVYWADGTVQTHTLEEGTISLGRAPGNDVVLQTSSASRYHAHVTVGPDGTVTLIDLGTVNGTFVNDNLLEPDASYHLVGGEEIRIGDVRLVYQSAESVSVDSAESAAAQTMHASARLSDLIVLLDEPHQSVAPGAQLQLILSIENVTSAPRTCDVELSGMDSKWVRANRQEVQLEPHEKTEVLILVRPPRAFTTPPGHYDLTVTVTSHGETEETIQHTRTIEVVSYHGLSVNVHPEGQPGQFTVHVENQGNVPVMIQLEGWQPQRVLKYEFAKTRVALSPGSAEQVALQVQFQGGKQPEPSTFAVVARSLEASAYRAPVLVKYTGSAESGGRGGGLLAPLVMVVMLGAAMIIVALGAAVFFFRDDLLGLIRAPPEPAVAAQAPPPTVSTQLPSSQPTSSPFPQPSSVTVAFDPESVIRYEDERILLRYVVEVEPGISAEELSLELYDETHQVGLANFTVAQLEGEVNLGVLLGSEWLVRIYQDGEPLTYSLRVGVRNSAQTISPPATLTIQQLDCIVSREQRARTGPGEDYQPADPTLVPGENYWPTAQAITDDVLWYRLQPGETDRWLEASKLTCLLALNPWQAPPKFSFLQAGEDPAAPSP